MIKWAAGASNEETPYPKWWPLYHRILEAGKSVMVAACNGDDLLAYRREFEEQCKRMHITTWARTAGEARRLLQTMEF